MKRRPHARIINGIGRVDISRTRRSTCFLVALCTWHSAPNVLNALLVNAMTGCVEASSIFRRDLVSPHRLLC